MSRRDVALGAAFLVVWAVFSSAASGLGGGTAGERDGPDTPRRAASVEVPGGTPSRSPAGRPRTNRAKAVHVIRHTWPAGQWVNAIRVTGCETGGTWNRWTRGSAGEVSIWQIHPASHPWLNVARAQRDQWYAARSALKIWRSAGWGAWTCARILGIA